MSVYCPILLALVLLSSSLFLPSACAAVTSVDALVDCRSSLSRYYDSNNDGWLQKTEYIILVQEQPTGCVFTDFSAVDATFTIFACPEDCVSTSSATATATATATCCPGFRPTQLNLAEIDVMSFCVLVLSAIQADCGAPTPTPATEPAIKVAAVLGPSTTTTTEQQQQQQAKGLQVYAIVLISFAGAMGLFIVYWFGLHHHPHHAHHSHGRRPNGGGGGTTTIRKKKRPKPQDADSTGIRTPSTKGPSPQVSDSSHDDELQDLERLATLTTTTSMMRASDNTTYIPADMDESIGVDRRDETGPSPRVLSSSFGCHPLPSPTKNYINKKIKNHDIQNGNRNGKVAFRMDATGAITQVELSPCTTLTASASSSSYYSEDVEEGILVQCSPTTLLGCHPSQMERSSAASAKDHDDDNQEHDDDDDYEHDHDDDDDDAEDMMFLGTRSGTTTTIPCRQSPIAVRRKRQTDSGRYGDHRAVSSSGLVETIHADEDHSKGLGGERDRDRDGGAGDAEHIEKEPYAAFYDDHTTSKIASSGLIETDQTLENDPYYGGVYYGENDDGEDDGGAMAAQMSRIATEDPIVTANGVPVYGGVYYGSDGEDDDDHEPQPSIDEEEEGFLAGNLPEDGGTNAPPTSSSDYNYYFAGIRRPTTPSGSIRSGRSRSSSQQQGQQPQHYHASPHSISTLGQNSAGMDQNSSAGGGGGGGGGEDWSSVNSRDSRRSWNSRDTVHSAEELEWQRRLRDDQLHSVTEEDTGALNTSMISQQQSQHQSTATSRTITTTNVGYTRRAP